jgi:hypothetical protein
MLTHKEKEIVFKACELIEAGEEWASCWALADSAPPLARASIVHRYQEFYVDQVPHENVVRNNWFGFGPTANRHRIMALLFFAFAEDA